MTDASSRQAVLSHLGNKQKDRIQPGLSKEAASKSSVQVLSKIMALLDCLAEYRELSAAALAEATGQPRSTINRLLGSLQAIDMVEPGSRRGTYRLGLKLLRLGSAVIARFDERQAALPVMERIHELTGETVFLCIRRDFEAVCIERLDGRRVQSLALRLGGSLPLHVGAAPRLLLAYEPRQVWEDYASGEISAWTPKTPTTKGDLFHHLEEVRRLGYSVSDEDVALGFAALGAPIFDFSGRIRAALSISGIRPAILGEGTTALCDLVVESAQQVSRALGWNEPTAIGTAAEDSESRR